MKAFLWGVRGSVPAPGPHTARYGGNTPCVAVEHEGARLILDAGTGIRGLGAAMMVASPEGTANLLLSHVHWDHIQGIPFFAPLYSEGWTVRVYGPTPEPGDLGSALRRQMASPHFPVHFASIASRLEVTEITAEPREIGPFQVEGIVLRHPGRTFGYRVTPAGGGLSVSYLTDNELAGPGEWGRLVGFLRGTDVLVHDAMFTEPEARSREGWGHSSIERVVDLAVAAEVARVVLFHHDPGRTDEEMDRLLEAAQARAAGARSGTKVEAAVEGRTL